MISLMSCSSGNSLASASSELDSQKSTMQESASSSKEDDSLEKADYSSLPYLSSVSALKKTDWKGKWIWMKDKNPKDSYFAFRKSFSLDRIPALAKLYLSCDTKATIFVNGMLAGVDVNVKRGASMYDSFYSTLDILPYLKQGNNVLAIEVNYFGRSGNSSLDSGHGGLLFDFDLGDRVISSDDTVKVMRLKAYKNQTSLRNDYPAHPMNSFLAEHCIYFDANEAFDYQKPDASEDGFENAAVIATPGYLPFGELYSSEIPPFEFSKDVLLMSGNEELLGKPLSTDMTLTFKLPENMQFLPYFELEAKGKEHIVFYTNTRFTQGLDSFVDDYICKTGSQSYQQNYWRSGYEFIMEVPKGVTVRSVGYRRTRYASERIGIFESDDKAMNTLFTKAVNTLDICMRDTYMDCPERERSPYTGDGANQIAETMYALDEEGWKLAKKTYLALPGWVGKDNIIPSRSPSGVTNEIPLQNLAFLVTAYDYYLQSGDAETMKIVYPIFMNYLKVWKMDGRGLVEYRDGTFPWVDWGRNADADLLENAFYAYALKRVEMLGRDLGLLKDDEKEFLESRYSSIKSHFRDYYLTEENDGFASKNEKGRLTVDDRANAVSVLAGLVDENDYGMVKNVLLTTEYASPYMERFVLESLCVMGCQEEAKTRMLRRYDSMIKEDISTLWESWSSKSEEGTINHGWAGGCMVVMSKYFSGIRSLKSGYEEYVIAPSRILKNHSASVMTPKGLLSYSMKQENGMTTFMVDAIDAKGTFVIDPSFGSSVTVDGEKVESFSVSLSGGKHTIVVK